MIFPLIPELSLIKVFDRGVENKECIAIAVEENTPLGQFCILIGVYQSEGFAIPLLDHLFWFGDSEVNKGDWIFVYTGPGKASVGPKLEGDGRIVSIHWGKPQTVFANTNIVPMLLRMDAIGILEPPRNMLQIPN